MPPSACGRRRSTARNMESQRVWAGRAFARPLGSAGFRFAAALEPCSVLNHSAPPRPSLHLQVNLRLGASSTPSWDRSGSDVYSALSVLTHSATPRPSLHLQVNHRLGAPSTPSRDRSGSDVCSAESVLTHSAPPRPSLQQLQHIQKTSFGSLVDAFVGPRWSRRLQSPELRDSNRPERHSTTLRIACGGADAALPQVFFLGVSSTSRKRIGRVAGSCEGLEAERTSHPRTAPSRRFCGSGASRAWKLRGCGGCALLLSSSAVLRWLRAPLVR
jgi:hypothetical protein